MSSDSPIGVFDSGVGGLTVAREIMRQIPNETIIYFGDTARVPYGNKSKETIIKYSRQIIRFLIDKGVKAIVIACNTATAFAREEMSAEFDIPIIGVVRPGANAAAADRSAFFPPQNRIRLPSYAALSPAGHHLPPHGNSRWTNL